MQDFSGEQVKAREASQISAKARAKAESGGDIADGAVRAMEGIRNSSKEISAITSVIDEIAFQTNLLALNAGVEAARAGDAGRGFAVVATEVRALAQRSANAAKEIESLVTNASKQVDQGVDLVGRTGVALEQIVASVEEISTSVSAISAASTEQTSRLEEINAATTELDHVTQQNVAMFEATNAANASLSSEVHALVEGITAFRVQALSGPTLFAQSA